MARAVCHKLILPRNIHELPNQLNDLAVIYVFLISTHIVGLAESPARENLQHRPVVVFNVHPVADLLTRAIMPGCSTRIKSGDLTPYLLFDVQVGVVTIW